MRVMPDFDTRGNGSFVLKPDLPKSVVPILMIDAGETKVGISAGLVEGDAHKTVYAPWYLFMPYTFQESKAAERLYRPSLDEGGTALLKLFLNLMQSRPNQEERCAAPATNSAWLALAALFLAIGDSLCRLFSGKQLY